MWPRSQASSRIVAANSVLIWWWIAWLTHLELHQVTSDSRYLEAGQQGLAYEQSHFDASLNNWPDFRQLDSGGMDHDEPVYAVAWCHGAAGIGLSRLRAHAISGDPHYLQQAYAAIATTQKHISQSLNAPGFDFIYCHGVAGNAELLLQTDQLLGFETYSRFLRGVADWGPRYL